MEQEKKKYKYKIRLNKPEDVKRLLARIVNEVRDGDITESSARCQGNLLGVLLKAFELTDLQKRVEALENGRAEEGNFKI